MSCFWSFTSVSFYFLVCKSTYLIWKDKTSNCSITMSDTTHTPTKDTQTIQVDFSNYSRSETVSTKCSICGGRGHDKSYHPCQLCPLVNHSTTEHTCKLCNQKGHGEQVVCIHHTRCSKETRRCKLKTGCLNKPLARCELCNLYNHSKQNHICEICNERGHEKQNHKCKLCYNIGHTTEQHPVCTYCSSAEHLTQEHRCERCSGEGHSFSEHKCIYCVDNTHSTEDHTCTLCNGKGHKEQAYKVETQTIHFCLNAPLIMCTFCNQPGHDAHTHHCIRCKTKGHEVINFCKQCWNTKCAENCKAPLRQKITFCPVVQGCLKCDKVHPNSLNDRFHRKKQ